MALTASPVGVESAPTAAPRTGTSAVSTGPFANTEPAGNASIRTGGAGATIRATVLPQRAANTTIAWSTSSPLISLSSSTGSSVVVTGHNATDHAEYADITAKAANGFHVTSHIYVEPAYIDPPVFIRKPVLGTPVNSTISVSYALNLGGRDDQSIISWYLCDDAACSTRREVAVSRGNQPLRQFTLTPGSVGQYVEAAIQPKHNISDPGPETSAISARPIAATDIKSATINPNFRNFVVTTNTSYVSGMWTVLGNWTSSTGENLVNGYGLRIASQGAALLYQRDDPTTDMQVKIVMTPEKTAGQGFGIAGSPSDQAGDKNQKADIYIKYDPRTRNGYSLRFWRTTESAEKCMFQLYQIVNGIGHPVDGQQQLTGVFKPNTTITLSIVGSTFTAKGSNSVDAESLSLKGTIVPKSYGGAGISWSGSVPFGNSNVISQFEISYPKEP